MSINAKRTPTAAKQALVCAALICANHANGLEAIPSFYQEPGLSGNRDYVSQQMNEHIDPFTGKLQLHYVDLFLPGNGGLDIRVQRSYNSQDELLTEPTALGVGWTIHFGRVLRRAILGICTPNVIATNAPVLELPDGSRQLLYLSLDRTFTITTNRYKAVCAPDGGGLIVSAPDGTRYEMTTAGGLVPAGGSPISQQSSFYTTRIVDRNGNTLDFTYTSVNALTTVSRITSSDGREVNFNYVGSTLDTVTVDSVTGGTRTWKYTYDTSIANYPFLTQVTRPDGLTWKYAYNMVQTDAAGAFSMKQLTYPTGGTFDYSYGFVSFSEVLPRSTVVTQKAGAGGTWTFSYNPATKIALSDVGTYSFTEDAMMDRTFVTAPDGIHTYLHVGANSVGVGGIYAIGLMLAKSIGSGYENEVRTWDVQIISDTINQRPGAPMLSDAVVATILPKTTVVTRNGQNYRTTNSNFDPFGNPQTIEEQGTANSVPELRTTQRTYNVIEDKWILHLPRDETISTIGSITRTYDPNGNLLIENRFGVATEITYTGEGDLATKKDARGNITTYEQYKHGIPRAELHPESVTIVRTVDDFGNVTSQTDGEAATTGYTYDGLNRLTSIVHPVGNPVSVTWGQNSRVVQRGLFREFTTFDAFGRQTEVQVDGSAQGPIIQTHRYDSLGRRIFSSHPNSTRGMRFMYDPLGRVFSTVNLVEPAPNGTFVDLGAGSRTLFFSGNTVRNTDERNFSYTMTYQGYGNPNKLDLLHVAAPNAAANVTVTRNGLGQPLTVDQAGRTRTYTYDGRYFLVEAVNPETGTTIYGRDQVGNMTSRQVGTSGVTAYAYDGRNRLTTITYPAGTPSITKTYFRDDLLKSVDNSLARRDYLYSPTKSLTRETLSVDAREFTVVYDYDGNDALRTMTYSTGLTLDYAPDGLGRSTRLSPFASAVAFQPNGLLKQIAYNNGVVSNFEINARQWPSNVTVNRLDGSGVLNLTNSYDRAGNVTNISESVMGELNRTLGYDSLDRLQNVTRPGASGTIAYDGGGNILSKQLGATSLSYQYDANNRLSVVSGSQNMSFTYDAYGNVTSNSRNQFQYDDALTMRCVDCSTPNEIGYLYDGLGNRVREQKGGLTTWFMYGRNGNLMFEVESSGVKREYGYVANRNIARKVSQ